MSESSREMMVVIARLSAPAKKSPGLGPGNAAPLEASSCSRAFARSFRSITALLGLSICLAGAPAARATTDSYIFMATGNGFLGTNAFTNATFTITATADPNKITATTNGIYHVTNQTATVTVSGFAPATFTQPTISVDNGPRPSAGLSDPGQNLAILFVTNSVFAHYDLYFPLSLVAGKPTFNANSQFMTTAGAFSLSSASNGFFESFNVPQPRISALVQAPSTNTVFATNCIAGVIYTVQENADLTTTNWVNLGSVTAQGSAVTNALVIFNFAPSNSPASFFRVYH